MWSLYQYVNLYLPFVIFFPLKSSLSGNNIVDLACFDNIFLEYVIWLVAYRPHLSADGVGGRT